MLLENVTEISLKLFLEILMLQAVTEMSDVSNVYERFYIFLQECPYGKDAFQPHLPAQS